MENMFTSFFYVFLLYIIFFCMLLLKKDNYKEIFKIFSLTVSLYHKIQSQKYQTLFDFSESGALPHCIMQMIFAETARNRITKSEEECEDQNRR